MKALAALALATLASPAFAQSPQIIKAHYTAKDQQVLRYVNVPFDVPAGATRVEIDLKYDKANGENVVDLGLLEPGSLALGTSAFRGWTGGERNTIFVSAADATPRGFERRYWLSSADFYDLYQQGLLDDGEHSEDFALWAAYHEVKQDRETTLQQLSDERVKRLRRKYRGGALQIDPREPTTIS